MGSHLPTQCLLAHIQPLLSTASTSISSSAPEAFPSFSWTSPSMFPSLAPLHQCWPLSGSLSPLVLFALPFITHSPRALLQSCEELSQRWSNQSMEPACPHWCFGATHSSNNGLSISLKSENAQKKKRKKKFIKQHPFLSHLLTRVLNHNLITDMLGCCYLWSVLLVLPSLWL